MSKQAKIVSYFLILLMVMCFIMVTLGGYVRLSGSGFSIPEWPLFTVGLKETETGELEKIRSVIPPSTEEGWTHLRDTFVREEPTQAGIAISAFQQIFWVEWSHRAFASLIGIVYLVYIALTFRSAELRRTIGRHALIGLGILLSQAVLGGLVVLFQLWSVKVALHLVVGFLFTAYLLWTYLILVHPPIPAEERKGPNPIRPLAIGLFVLICIQIFSGGLMAASQAGFQMNTWPRMGDYWVPPGMVNEGEGLFRAFTENKILIQFFHRWYAIIVAVAILFFVFRCMTVRVSRGCRLALRSLFAVVTLQVILGILTLLKGVHPHLALTHQSVGLVLVLLSLVTIYETACHKVVSEETLAAEAEERLAQSGKAPAHAA
jgi:cytochrome c oxidase assembly protein subunit 15